MDDYILLLALPSPEEMIRYGGLALICAIVFVETGVLIGLVIPGGDSLLFTAGLLCATDVLKTDIYLLVPLLIVCGILGDLLGYSIGKKIGPKLYKRPDSWIFKKKHLEKAQRFYNEKGKAAIIAGKFVPIVRTFNPLLSGVSKLPLTIYLPITAIASILWICTLVLIGYFIGRRFPWVEQYIHYIIPAIIFASLLPLIINYFRKKKESSPAQA